jgi:hypothetical protein
MVWIHLVTNSFWSSLFCYIKKLKKIKQLCLGHFQSSKEGEDTCATQFVNLLVVRGALHICLFKKNGKTTMYYSSTINEKQL